MPYIVGNLLFELDTQRGFRALGHKVTTGRGVARYDHPLSKGAQVTRCRS